MAAAVISQLTQALSFLRKHPKLSCVLLLLLSPPIYRILLYFTPLLLSTALCVFALITLTPYVTATDAEVERQSMLGASSQQPKKKTITSSSKERRLEGVSGYAKPSSSSSSSAYTSLSAASPSSSDAETSWFSWMKGLNDLGRTWMENKLTEQGLALSEPANRETLLAFIEGSFADLIAAQENPSAELFSAIDNHEEDDVVFAESAHSTQKNDEALNAMITAECVSEGYTLQKSIKEEGPCARFTSNGDDGALSEKARNEENVAVENLSETITSDVCAVSKEHSHVAYETKSMQGNPKPLLDVKERKQKPHVTHHEGSLPVMDGIPDTPAATIMPKAPSRIPAPSKLLEASRRIFSKEEQNKTMLPRVPLQASSAARVNQPLKSAFGSTQSKIESPISVFKLPARKFLERSRSIPSKEGSKLSSTTMGTQADGKVVQGEMNNDASYVSEANEGVKDVDGARNANDGAIKFTSGAGDDGPRFDEDLKVEEAQALVQSELKMLEVELDEVAAKLPKLDEAFAYQKTPVKNTTMSLTPGGASIKCSTPLFSESPTFKTS